MRHKRLGRKLGVVTKHRKAMLRNMVTDFLRHERIKTTDTRAKELRRFAEKVITLAKLGTLHARRQAAKIISDKSVLKRLFDEIAPKYKERPGGYTRIIKLGMRRGDNAPISMLELVEEEYKPRGRKKTKPAPEKRVKTGEASAEAKSRKKEAAEELGLVQSEEKPTEEAKEAPLSEGEAPLSEGEAPNETKKEVE